MKFEYNDGLLEGEIMNYSEESYWNDRANKMYMYKREKFYTITPIPYYYKRRKAIINLLTKHISASKALNVCDYGCGDGEYLRLAADYLNKKESQNQFVKWTGIDISDEMLKRARHNCRLIKDVNLEVSGTGIPGGGGITEYDIIYSVAVFAHVNDELINQLFNNFYEHMSKQGKLILCEQVGTRRIEGETYTRRTIAEYRSKLEKAGFSIKEVKLIDFWAHRIFFERRIAKRFYRKIDAPTYHDKQIEANRHFLFKMCSAIFTALSKPYVFQKSDGWGYMFIVAQKQM